MFYFYTLYQCYNTTHKSFLSHINFEIHFVMDLRFFFIQDIVVEKLLIMSLFPLKVLSSINLYKAPGFQFNLSDKFSFHIPLIPAKIILMMVK